MASDPVGIDTLNHEIPLWVEQNSSDDSPITVADCSMEVGYKIDMNSDGTHPNEAGDRLIANQIGPHLVRYVKDTIAERRSHDLQSQNHLGRGNEELRKKRNI